MGPEEQIKNMVRDAMRGIREERDALKKEVASLRLALSAIRDHPETNGWAKGYAGGMLRIQEGRG